MLADVVEEAEGSETPLALGEVRALLAERLQGRPTRTNFRTGSLTVCTLVPMRSVPHRVVCLLGLDDGEFPRKAPRDGDDLVLRDAHVGDRDARTEDRQMLLDALMAATDKLIVTFTGNDERTNGPARRPCRSASCSTSWTARCAATPAPGCSSATRCSRSTRATSSRRTRGASTARCWAARARWPAIAPSPGRSSPGPLPADEEEVVGVEDLVRFARHPVRAFLRRRLGVSVAEYDDEVEDALPVELDGLGRWSVGERILQARLGGADRRGAVLAEIARGTLPPGVLGKPVIEKVEPEVDAIVAQVERLMPGRRAPSTCACRWAAAWSAGPSPACAAACCAPSVLARERRATGSPRGCGCWR